MFFRFETTLSTFYGSVTCPVFVSAAWPWNFSASTNTKHKHEQQFKFAQFLKEHRGHKEGKNSMGQIYGQYVNLKDNYYRLGIQLF
jgi:hypothetical protein